MNIFSIFKQGKLTKLNSGSRRASNNNNSYRANYDVSAKINLSNQLIAFSFILILSLFLLMRASFTLTYKIETGDLLQNQGFFGRRFLTIPAHLQSDEPYADVLTCDRSHFRTDVCVARGDVRVNGYSVLVNAATIAQHQKSTALPSIKVVREEKIKPYTRKWEESVMNTIDEVSIVVVQNQSSSSSEINQKSTAELSRISPLIIRNQAVAYQHNAGEEDDDMTDGSNAAASVPNVQLHGNEHCDVRHDVPAVLFSTGGYTGNVYHEFNDGIIPLFITAEKYKGEVVLLLLEYHNWWLTKYAEILSQITKYPAVDLANDTRVHCFKEVTVGLRIHGELTIDETQKAGVSMKEFREMLHSAYLPRLKGEEEKAMEMEKLKAMTMANVTEFTVDGKQEAASPTGNVARINISDTEKVDMATATTDTDLESKSSIASPIPTKETINIQSLSSENRVATSDVLEDRVSIDSESFRSKEDQRLDSMDTQNVVSQENQPIKLLILSRNGSRSILNQDKIVKLAQEIGFKVSMVSPTPSTEMVELYWALSTCDVMLGVHGAAMTHLLFMRAHPSPATFIQVVPLGTQWAATTYYGEPATRLGLDYVEYLISPEESSLSESYSSDDPVLVDPDSVNARGWSETKRIYLDSQNVTLDLDRVKRVLTVAYLRAIIQRSNGKL